MVGTMTQLYGNSHVKVAVTLNDLSDLCVKNNDFTAAQEYHNKAKEVAKCQVFTSFVTKIKD
jgi:hypothetical protein